MFNAYTSRIRPALNEIPEKTFFGNRASLIIDLIENDFENTGNNNSRYLEIRENISKAEDLISTYKDELLQLTYQNSKYVNIITGTGNKIIP